MLTGLKNSSNRLITHFAMVVISLIGCGLAYLYLPTATLSEVITLGLGYVALLLLAVSLIIGPVNLLFKRRNPVNINLRRDIGIWAGITGLIHVVFSFQLFQGGDILAYFFSKDPLGYSLPQPDLFSFSNYVGLVATIVMAVLLITSNQLSLRYLKGKRWKFVQRFNYPLAALVVLHTFGYQAYNLREMVFIYSVIGLSVLVLAVQLGGVVVSIRRKQQRQLETSASFPIISPLQPVKPLNRDIMARRQFLILSGTAILTGVTVGVVGGRALLSNAPASGLTADATLPTANPTTAAPTATPTTPPATNNRTGRGRNGGFPGNTGNPNAGTNPNPANPNTGATNPANPSSSGAATTTPAASQTSAAATSTGKVLGTVASIPVGSAVQFTTPDTGENAFLIHEADGSVKAFSGICTHRPYNLVFDNGQQALVCYLHNVPFDIKSGAPRRSPARTALSGYKVQVDGQGNIVYSNS